MRNKRLEARFMRC